MLDDVIANTEIATLDSLGPSRCDELRRKVVAAELASSLGKCKTVVRLLTTHDHRTSSYLRRRMLDELEASGEYDGSRGQGAGTA